MAKLIEVAKGLLPGTKLRIRYPDWVDDDGPKWSGTLTDAQVYAYQEHEVRATAYNVEEDTCYVVLRKPAPAEVGRP